MRNKNIITGYMVVITLLFSISSCSLFKGEKSDNSGSAMTLLNMLTQSQTPQDNISIIASGISQTGWIQNACISGNYLYIAAGKAGLHIYDITTPATPSRISTIDTAGYAYAVAVNSLAAFVADGTSGVQVIDIQDKSAPSLLRTVTYNQSTSMDARDISISGHWGYVTDKTDGLHILINTDIPQFTVHDAKADSASMGVPQSMCIDWNKNVGGTDYNYIYVADETQGVHVIQSRIDNPAITHVYTGLRIIKNTNLVSARGCAVSGNYIYIADSDSYLRISDITNVYNISPTQPAVGWSIATGGHPYAVYMKGTNAYVADALKGRDAYLTVVDASTLSSLSKTEYRLGGDPRGITGSGNYVYVSSSYGGLHIVDISTPTSPSREKTIYSGGYCYDTAVTGNYIYAAAKEAGLLIIDKSTISSPVIINRVYETLSYGHEIPGKTYSVQIVGNCAYVGNSRGLLILNVSNPAAPAQTYLYNDNNTFPRHAYVSGSYAYCVSPDVVNDYFSIVNISNPASPTHVYSGTVTGNVEHIFVEGNYAYISSSSGVHIYDATTPASPVLVKTISSSDMDSNSAYESTVKGNYLYVAAKNLYIFDITSKASPVLVNTAGFGQYTRSIHIDGNNAYVGSLNAVSIMDISDPTTASMSTSRIGRGTTAGTGEAIIYDNGYMYLADGDEGIVILKLNQ